MLKKLSIRDRKLGKIEKKQVVTALDFINDNLDIVTHYMKLTQTFVNH